LDAAAIAKISKQLVNAGRVFNETEDLTKVKEALKEAGLDVKTEEKVIRALEEEGKNLPIKGTKEEIEEAVETSSSVLLNTSIQLQTKFKHAGDFGVLGNYSKANAGKFSSAINQHISSAGIQTINGTYRGQPVIHYLNPNSGLNVISSPTGQFISGWKLNPEQLQNVIKRGGL
jgi:Colicin D